MKCPYCGGEMMDGYLFSTRGGLFWSRRKPSMLWGGLDADRNIAPGFGLHIRKIPAFVCEACHKMITDLPEEQTTL